MAKLLLVDDAPANRLRLSHIVHSLGHESVQASDGARALAALEDNADIAALVTDWQMPNLDGPGLIRAVRESGRTLPIFVYSAFRGVQDVASLLERGASAFLAYPVPRDMLAEYLARYLEAPAGREEPA